MSCWWSGALSHGELLRPSLEQQDATPIAALPGIRHGTDISVAGLVIARQRERHRLLLLEDGGGTLNVIVPRKLYEPYRLTVRTEPLIVVHGRLERHRKGGGAINLLAKKIARLTPNIDAPTATVRDLRPVEEAPTSTAEDFALTAPAVMNFERGRGR